LHDHVRFLGFRSDVANVLAAADIFVFPSLYEGLGGSLIEAMAMKLPVVASDIPAIREVVEDGRSGYLAPPGNVSALAGAIQALLSDPERVHGFGERAREICEDRFAVERSAGQMVSLYQSLVL